MLGVMLQVMTCDVSAGLCPSDVSVWEEGSPLPGPCDGVTFRIRRGRGAHMPPYSDDVATSDASGMSTPLNTGRCCCDPSSTCAIAGQVLVA